MSATLLQDFIGPQVRPPSPLALLDAPCPDAEHDLICDGHGDGDIAMGPASFAAEEVEPTSAPGMGDPEDIVYFQVIDAHPSRSVTLKLSPFETQMTSSTIAATILKPRLHQFEGQRVVETRSNQENSTEVTLLDFGRADWDTIGETLQVCDCSTTARYFAEAQPQAHMSTLCVCDCIVF